MIHALAETTSEAYWDNYWFIHDCSITNKENQIDWWWRNWFSLALQCMPTHLCNFIKVLLVWCCSKLPIHVTGMSNYYHHHHYYWHFYHYHYMYDQYHLGIARLRHIQCGYREGQNKPALKLKHNHNKMVTSSNGNIFRVTGLCDGNPPVTGGFPSQRPVTQRFGVFFDLRLNKRLIKQ